MLLKKGTQVWDSKWPGGKGSLGFQVGSPGEHLLSFLFSYQGQDNWGSLEISQGTITVTCLYFQVFQRHLRWTPVQNTSSWGHLPQRLWPTAPGVSRVCHSGSCALWPPSWAMFLHSKPSPVNGDSVAYFTWLFENPRQLVEFPCKM